jgi:hypothetical protein
VTPTGGTRACLQWWAGWCCASEHGHRLHSNGAATHVVAGARAHLSARGSGSAGRTVVLPSDVALTGFLGVEMSMWTAN